MIARMLWKLPKYETLEVTYIGNSTIWRNLETYQRVSTQLEARLCDVEAFMLAKREDERQRRREEASFNLGVLRTEPPETSG
jgi:hypothetical protein